MGQLARVPRLGAGRWQRWRGWPSHNPEDAMQRPHVIERYLVSLGDLEKQGMQLSDLERDFLKVLRYAVSVETELKEVNEAGREEMRGHKTDPSPVVADPKPRLAPSSPIKTLRGKKKSTR